jgi:hypothetical protein
MADDHTWQYGLKAHAARETIETTSWPHPSFYPMNESARCIRDFFLTRDKARLLRSPWHGDRIDPRISKEMTNA